MIRSMVKLPLRRLSLELSGRIRYATRAANHTDSIMKEKILTMLELQDGMNSKVNPDWRNAGSEWYRAIWTECAEMLDHYGWKWWKHHEPEMDQVKLEIVDIWHFAMSAIIIDFGGDIQKSADTIAAQLASEATAVTFDGKNYDFAEQDILNNLELMAGLCAAKRFEVPLFIMSLVIFPLIDLIIVYILPHCVNL